MNVKLLRISTGEEVVAEIVEETADSITIRMDLSFSLMLRMWICSLGNCG